MTTTQTPFDDATDLAIEAQEKMPQWREQNVPMAQQGLRLVENIPAPAWMAVSLASIVASAVLYATGRKWAAVFVGLWPPTIVNMGMFARLLKPSRE